MTEREHHKIIKKAIKESYKTASKFYGKPFAVAVYDLEITSKNTIALADLDTNCISMNYDMFTENIRLFTRVIIPHEVSHHISKYFLGDEYHSRIFHGKFWRSVMRDCFKLHPSAFVDIKR